MTAVADRLRVALVSDSIYPYYQGGKEIRYHEIARRVAREADVTVYTMQWWDGPASRRDGAVGLRAVCGLHDLYRDGRRSLRQSLLFGTAALRLLFRRFDVIEVDTVPYPQIFALKLVAVLRRRPLVVTWHEVWDLRAVARAARPARVCSGRRSGAWPCCCRTRSSRCRRPRPSTCAAACGARPACISRRAASTWTPCAPRPPPRPRPTSSTSAG